MIERFEQSDGEHNSENAIVSASVWDGIEMRADEQTRRSQLRGRVEAAQISCGVDGDFGSGGAQPFRDFAVAVPHRRREKRAACAARIFGESGEKFAAGQDLFGAIFCVFRHGHEALPPAAEACFYSAVRLVDRHENFVGIVLAETREVDEKTMQVGHRQRDVFDFRDSGESGFAHGVQSVLDGFAGVRSEYA